MQTLFYSTPFREHVVSYPPHSPYDTPNGLPKLSMPSIRPPPVTANGNATSPTKTKVSASEAMKKRTQINAGQIVPPGPGQRPEDKPDSPEYKKKHAMLAGPVLDITYTNATNYGMEESTFTAMKDIFMALIAHPARSGVLSPARFLEIFKRDNEMFRTSMHQDAHEFYGLVLNAVINNVEDNAQRVRELEPPRTEEGLVQGLKDAVTYAADSMGLGAGARSPGTGWVHDIFEGVLTSETKCLTCETASQRDETFLDLSIDLDNHSSVSSCLRKFSAEEMLCERNKFHCDSCGGLQEAEKRMKIKRLPKILTLHLKRFKYSDDMTRLTKLFHRVVYPYHLRMFNTTDDAEDPDRLYELYAVVVHIGSNAFHGHYVSIIKTQDRGWLLFDDEMVEPVDKHYVRNFFGDKPGQACAYVLFYQETTEEAMRKEMESEGLAQVALASQEAELAQGHLQQSNGTYPASVSKQASLPATPEEQEEFVSLDNVISTPLPISQNTATVPLLSSPTSEPASKVKTKEDKARAQKEIKESKEAEKAKKAAEKAAEKEKAKAEEKRLKEVQAARKEELKAREEEAKRVIALSKQTAAEEEEKRKKEAAGNGVPARASTFAEPNGQLEKEKGFMGSLSRSHRGSKSMSRKSFGFLGSKESKASGSGDTAVEGESGPQTPEKNQKPPKERFSFNLGRKKSSLMNP
ncbi:hypothetical protein B0O99DRAFT_273661 [Bisporella sp. PMI_857]|nr:hypothetical protein B0O99DRAFT_273661 [Bisporella sp. PMI_857]